MSDVDHSYGHALVDRDSVIAGGHDTYRVAVGIQHLIPVTGYCAVMDLQSHELAFKPFGFLCHKSVAAYEFRLVELDEYTETCLQRGYVGGEFVAVQRQSDLEAQGVAGSRDRKARSGPRP